ncbi:menaquinone biosynthesis prenyltransferase MqnP [Aliarcobacter skirrowii]|uniref:4-hydroxybenzoate polyprenyltransferase n=1 Tax=Aliarcobacter skirrowii CCUG 10374 TaxID=1032239 RepID=A0AAD0WMI5_9BACT|nr:menaquinone biosynthesis prenyltransferase MqnP [Aliarcobacter skirrowii]AXX83907.1 4-hydroxybenzoate octaprenyltransferase [Aliarcobacter skirrowii CCUG 10374]KAB0621895.1 4-hydroxybenzoate polyprenyltransferase [Aliarcobacter skirrowii CCUG 10374]RXI27146.1 4-hydroxybenzoate octaprenyltransferase [Aliarcobacter skirrowii CCUG 10374]SUU95599.1 4-hydroxybenzoate octaprenyltransferase [Aliarcobacter skirrowii]HAC70209.1 4-hydroxybenzoate polyprenyltransferase [Aliarcobacter skirrowii]
MEKLIKKIKDFSELVVFQHSVFALPFIFIAMVVSSSQINQTPWFGFKLLVLGTLCAIFARNFAMGFNRYMDRDIDGLNPRTSNRPNVDGRISANSMLAFVIFNAIAFIVVAYLVNSLALILSVPILVIIGSYSYFKRFSYLAHIILGISLALAPIAGVVAVSESIPFWVILLSIGVMFWVAGFDLLYSLQDIDVDKKLGLHSIPSKFGAKKTMLFSKVFHFFTVLFWLLFVIYSSGSYFAYFAVVISALMLSYEHYLVNKDFRKIDRAFFTVNGYLGIVFFFLIVLDNIFF